MKGVNKLALVFFGQGLPRKSQKWWRQFDKIIAPKSLEEEIRNRGGNFIDIESLTSPGSIQQANVLVNKLPYVTLADGRRVSKLVNWQGFELWWIHFDDLYDTFCLPYTQYHELLEYLKNFDKIYFYQPPYLHLFRYFLKAHNRQCVILSKFRPRNLLPIPFGIFIQVIFSSIFLLWLRITNPKLMVWTGDKFEPPNDYDHRMKSTYEELRKKEVSFVEFIRSLESWSTVLRHAWLRKRPVIYSGVIIDVVHFLTHRFSHFPISFSVSSPEGHFWFLVAAHYLHNIKGTIWSILAMKFILRWIGVKVAIICTGSGRTFHEVLGCKLAGIKTLGIQDAALSRYIFVSNFMSGFDGGRPLSVGKYGLWSERWREYYLKYSQAYKPEQLYVSGPSSAVEKEIVETASFKESGTLKVVFISEQLAAPQEVMPYLLKLLETKDLALYIKFRPYRDGFEEWLRKHQPDILKKVGIFRGSPQQAAAQSDVVVGSHSSAVLEALLQLKPIVFFWTNKWGDYFGVKDLDKEGQFFASNPEELVEYIRKSGQMSQDILKQLQERFFGDPSQNGGKWVVEQAIKYLNEYKKNGTK